MYKKSVQSVKRAQKEAQIAREIANLFLQVVRDNKELEGLFVNHVKLSADAGICTVFFYTPDGKESFDKKLPLLILYKPSLRKALSQSLNLRYTPDLIFRYDAQGDKQREVEELLNKIKLEEQ